MVGTLEVFRLNLRGFISHLSRAFYSVTDRSPVIFRELTNEISFTSRHFLSGQKFPALHCIRNFAGCHPEPAQSSPQSHRTLMSVVILSSLLHPCRKWFFLQVFRLKLCINFLCACAFSVSNPMHSAFFNRSNCVRYLATYLL